MKGTENIIAQINAEAKAEADRIIAEAEAKCAEIRADYDAKAKSAYAERVRAGVKDCEDRAESMSKIADMEARKSLLSLKQELVSAGFDKALSELVSLPEEEYIGFLKNQALKSITAGDEELVLNGRDKNAVGERLLNEVNEALKAEGKKAEVSLAADTGDFAGGLVVRSGNIETNCTAELLINMCRNDMASVLAGVLFE